MPTVASPLPAKELANCAQLFLCVAQDARVPDERVAASEQSQKKALEAGACALEGCSGKMMTSLSKRQGTFDRQSHLRHESVAPCAALTPCFFE